jgi:hypothetical protein
VARHGHDQCAYGGEATSGEPMVKMEHDLRENDPLPTSYMLLHLTLHGTAGKVLSLMRWSGGQQPTASTVETGSKSKKISLGRLHSCTRMPRALGKYLPVMRSMEEGAHQQMVEVNGEIRCRGRRGGA